MPRADSGSKTVTVLTRSQSPEGSANNMASEDATVKAVMDAMKPMLDLMKSEIVASQQAAIIQLKESFLQQILQLNETISEYTTRVCNFRGKDCRIAKGDEGNQNRPETQLLKGKLLSPLKMA
jgi:hypothetical protein